MVPLAALQTQHGQSQTQQFSHFDSARARPQQRSPTRKILTIAYSLLTILVSHLVQTNFDPKIDVPPDLPIEESTLPLTHHTQRNTRAHDRQPSQSQHWS